MNLRSNNKLFFYFDNGNIVACNSENQEYFTLETDYFLALQEKSKIDPAQLSIASAESNRSTEITNDLKENNFILSSDDKAFLQKDLWEGDPISFFAHSGSRILSKDLPLTENEVFINNLFEVSENAENLSGPYVPEYIKEIKLPKPDLTSIENKLFLDVLKARKTSRNFDSVILSLDQINTLLYLGFGPIHGDEWIDFKKHNLHAYGTRTASPSTTGLQGCEGYLIIKHVEGLEEGIYLYSRENHSLYMIEKGLENNFFSYATADQFWSNNLSAGIFIVTDLKRTWIKDTKNRGYLMSYADAGHVSQTLLLSATSLGMHTWITGTFRDDYVAEKLKLPSYHRFSSFFIGLGRGSNDSIPKKFIEQMKK